MKLGLGLVLLFVSGCAAYHPPVVLQPTESATVRGFFSNGQPIAVIRGDSCAMMLAVEPDIVAGQPYTRVWWLYTNQSRRLVLIEPLVNVSVVSRDRRVSQEPPLAVADSARPQQKKSRLFPQRAISNRRGSRELRFTPVPPSLILHRIENAKAVASITQTIGGALKAAAASYEETTNPPTITGPPGTATISDPGRARERAQAEWSRTEDAIAATRFAYDLYARSVNNGVLRRNTVLPGDGVHGYVYLPCLPAEAAEYGHPERSAMGRLEDAEHLVVIRVGAYADSVLFTPVAGE